MGHGWWDGGPAGTASMGAKQGSAAAPLQGRASRTRPLLSHCRGLVSRALLPTATPYSASQDGPELMARAAEEWALPFPYLFDEVGDLPWVRAGAVACVHSGGHWVEPQVPQRRELQRWALSVPCLCPACPVWRSADAGGGQSLRRRLHARLLPIQKGQRRAQLLLGLMWQAACRAPAVLLLACWNPPRAACFVHLPPAPGCPAGWAAPL